MDWLMILLSFLHLLPTAMWIGGVMFMSMVLMPTIEGMGGGPALGSLMVKTAKRFITVVWISIILFFVTGAFMTYINESFSESLDLGSPWMMTIFIKHILVVVMVICAAIQTKVIGQMDKIMSKGPPERPPSGAPPEASGEPPALQGLKKRSAMVGAAVLVLGILVLLLTAMAEGM